MLLLQNSTSTTLLDTSSVDMSDIYDMEDPGKPPEPIISDYVEMFTLVFNFIIGAPLNLAAYTQVGNGRTFMA